MKGQTMTFPNGTKTFLGIALTLAGFVAENTDALVIAFPEYAWLPKAGMLAGMIMAAYGRAVAQGPVKVKRTGGQDGKCRMELLATITALGLLAAAFGCSGVAHVIEDRPALSKAAVSLATVRFCDSHPEYAKSVERIATALTDPLGPGTLPSAAAFIRQKIDYTSLAPETAIAIDALIDTVQAEAVKMLEASGVSEDAAKVKETIKTVSGWVAAAARLVKA